MKWRPIDIAPRDGTLILAWAPDWKYPDLIQWRDGNQSSATHWLALPPIPVVANCIHCGERFVKNRKNAKICSDACANRVRVRRFRAKLRGSDHAPPNVDC